MDAIITVIALAVVNISVWIYTYGRLSQKVDILSDAINNGLCDKVEGISRHLSKLEGIVEMVVKTLTK